MAIVGVTTNIVIVIAGVILTVCVIVAWIRDTRRDIDELPLEHDH
jgi:predicted tellurium resistance membrane protein TerC